MLSNVKRFTEPKIIIDFKNAHRFPNLELKICIGVKKKDLLRIKI